MADAIEVRLPLSSNYLPVLRATVGVLAGIMLFNYDEIIQIRAAVSEAFNLAARWVKQERVVNNTDEVWIRFLLVENGIEIFVLHHPNFVEQIKIEREEESSAVLESLMDEVRYGCGKADEPLISMTKYNSTGTSPKSRVDRFHE